MFAGTYWYCMYSIWDMLFLSWSSWNRGVEKQEVVMERMIEVFELSKCGVLQYHAHAKLCMSNSYFLCYIHGMNVKSKIMKRLVCSFATLCAKIVSWYNGASDQHKNQLYTQYWYRRKHRKKWLVLKQHASVSARLVNHYDIIKRSFSAYLCQKWRILFRRWYW